MTNKLEIKKPGNELSARDEVAELNHGSKICIFANQFVIFNP